MKRVNFMGSSFHSISMNESVKQIVSWCENSEQTTRTVITLNAGLLMTMRKNQPLNYACNKGGLILADGKPIVLASKMLGDPIAHRVAGVDLMQETLKAANETGLSVYFLGARQEIIDKLKSICEERYPNATIAGSQNGYFSIEDHSQVIEAIAKSGADILYIGMPSPFKEIWGEQYRDRLGVKVIFGVGGSFDVLAGAVKRAPVLIQNLCLEWAWRLAMEPRKLWKRYLVTNTEFLYRFGVLLGRRYILKQLVTSKAKA